MSRERWNAIEAELNTRVIDQQDTVHGLILAALSGQHVLLFGPPGTAKSMTIRMLAEYLEASYMTHLMGKFTTPDEIFGPVDIQSLKAGVYKRIVTGKLPDVQVAFLDEVFKANTAILNSTLKIMQEREFDNNGDTVKCPLLFMSAASNELPEEGEGLSAVYDRFLLRYLISNVTEEHTFKHVLQTRRSRGKRKVNTVTASMYEDDRDEVMGLELSDEAYTSLSMVMQRLSEAGIINSMRRYDQMVDVMAADSWLRGKGEIDSDSIMVGCNILWQKPDQIRDVGRIVRQSVNPITALCADMQAAIVEGVEKLSEYSPSDDVIQAIKQIRLLKADAAQLGESTQVANLIQYMDEQIESLMQMMVK